MTKEQILKCFIKYEPDTPNEHYRIPVRTFEVAIKNLCEPYENIANDIADELGKLQVQIEAKDDEIVQLKAEREELIQYCAKEMTIVSDSKTFEEHKIKCTTLANILNKLKANQ